MKNPYHGILIGWSSLLWNMPRAADIPYLQFGFRQILLAVGAWTALGSLSVGQERPSAVARPLEPRTYMGRTIAPTMHFTHADWLTRKTRKQEEDPQQLLNALGIAQGQTLCDFGCGNGYYTIQLARRVGPQGIVYAVDIQPEMLELVRQRAESRGLKNIVFVLADPLDPKLPPEKLDLVLMVDVYHELDDPPPILSAIRRSLKPTGIIAVVEFREEDPQVPILPLHKMSKSQTFREFTANQFVLVRQYDELPWQHVLYFASKDGRLKATPLKEWSVDIPGVNSAQTNPSE